MPVVMLPLCFGFVLFAGKRRMASASMSETKSVALCLDLCMYPLPRRASADAIWLGVKPNRTSARTDCGRAASGACTGPVTDCDAQAAKKGTTRAPTAKTSRDRMKYLLKSARQIGAPGWAGRVSRIVRSHELKPLERTSGRQRPAPASRGERRHTVGRAP